MLFVDLDTAKTRYNICKNCERFRPIVKSCNICNCFMPGKVMLEFAVCPLQKWGKGTGTKSTADYTYEDFK